MVTFSGSKIMIVREENEERFAERVEELFNEGYRPAAEFKAFADWDEQREAWRTLYTLPLFKFTEGSDAAEGSPLEMRRMFG